jgi:hypothetical protein
MSSWDKWEECVYIREIHSSAAPSLLCLALLLQELCFEEQAGFNTIP